ncbi:stalk domain-containing protein [Heliophilum fasciatum]|uniref:Ig-like domain-containing protein n=1 Tax=Heliophilum fasciatum TaxID=35700 RepID=A0A4R2RYL1_9FIRM|nr:stalk domain-containing protein [Heliophilum fasciatum]MCW2276902.1 methionine-rich copper-binding protein CopC [Heliophilum fasciatum]TCP68638.1 Ig-like domain-containing protein [Heliophilum fasciatum]
MRKAYWPQLLLLLLISGLCFPFTFALACGPSHPPAGAPAPPQVTATSPVNGATATLPLKEIIIVFSHAVSPCTSYGDIALRDGQNQALSIQTKIDDRQLTIYPQQPLQPEATYRLIVPVSAVSDMYNQPNIPAFELTFQTAAGPRVLLNQKDLAFTDAQPFFCPKIEQLLVPLRAVSTTLGAPIRWDGATQSAIISYQDRQIRLTPAQKQAWINEQPRQLSNAPVLFHDRLYIPLPAVQELFGIAVTWDEATQTATITTTAS